MKEPSYPLTVSIRDPDYLPIASREEPDYPPTVSITDSSYLSIVWIIDLEYYSELET